jgi:uncharacterized protein YndB with AHSA1/START domain
MTIETDSLTITKTVHVDVAPERAFAAFTKGIAAWWPTESHSIGQGRVEADWRPGGVVREVVGDEVHEWADVLEVEPPRFLSLRWRVGEGSPPTEVRVSFTPDGGGTSVELVHLGWGTEEQAGSYDEGWTAVLGRFATHAG